MIEFRFIKTKKLDPILIDLDMEPDRKKLHVWAAEVKEVLDPLPNPFTIEDIIDQMKKIISDDPWDQTKTILAVGALLNMRYLEIVNF